MEQWFANFALTNHTTAGVTQDRCYAFLHALLSTTLSHLEVMCHEKVVVQGMEGKPRLATLASEFRDRMAQGRTFGAHGPYRTNFYDAVITQAQEVMLPSFPRIQFITPPPEPGRHSTFHPPQQHRRQPACNPSSGKLRKKGWSGNIAIVPMISVYWDLGPSRYATHGSHETLTRDLVLKCHNLSDTPRDPAYCPTRETVPIPIDDGVSLKRVHFRARS